MIAGLVEHLASHDQLTPPAWIHDEDLFLDVLWYGAPRIAWIGYLHGAIRDDDDSGADHAS